MTIRAGSIWKSRTSGAIVRVFRVDDIYVAYTYISTKHEYSADLKISVFLSYFRQLVDMDAELELLD